MADITETAKSAFSGISFSGIGTGITIFVSFILFAIIVGVIMYFILMMKKYKYKITDFTNIAGQGYIPTGKDKAMLIKIGDSGEEVLFLRKSKRYRPAYGLKIGKNQYAYAIGEDGYPYNIKFGDLHRTHDTAVLTLQPIDKDMRYAYAGIRKGLKQEFGEKKSWLKENIGIIVGIVSIIIVLVFMWLMADKYFTIFSQVGGIVKEIGTYQQTQSEAVTTLARLCGENPGFKVI